MTIVYRVISHLFGFAAFLLDAPSRLARMAYMQLAIKSLEYRQK